ncbi:unnamed protein product [Penicillium bialowiezense]
MKTIMTILLALVFVPGAISSLLGVSGAPTEPDLTNAQANHPLWNFDLFHNKHCRGTTISYAGQGTSGCRNNLEAGGAEAFIDFKVQAGAVQGWEVLALGEDRGSHDEDE